MSLLVRIDLAYSKSQELKNSRIPHDVPVAYIRRSIGIEYRLEAYASMKPNLSRLAAKNVFFLFLVNFDRHLATTHIFGFGA
jgi:hypothetical protein